jgi:hypothetical protein
MKQVKRSLSVALSIIMLGVILSGCGNKDNSAEVKELKGQIEGLTAQNTALQSQLSGMAVTEVTPETSLKTIEGSDIPTFGTIDGKINFPNKLMLPNSKDDINNSNIMVGSRFKYTPSSNWLTKMNGATLDLTHPAKIWGSIRSVAVKEVITEVAMQPLLKTFFSGFPATTITYRKIFMSDRVSGMLATANMVVDKKPYVTTVGFLTRGEIGQLYIFTYEDNKSGVQQELIDLLIGTATNGETKISIE